MNVGGVLFHPLHANYNKRLGIANTIRLCRAVNGVVHRARQHHYSQVYLERFDEVLKEHDGYPGGLPRNLLQDGFVIDRSGTLPHLAELLQAGDELIKQRGGKDRSKDVDAQQPWFYSLLRPQDLQDYPAILNFALSSQVLASIGHAMGCVPMLSKTQPPGVRFMESNSRFDPTPEAGPRASQLYHLDLHSVPLLYVIVLLRDATLESGPWHFLSRSTSERAARLLGYQRRGQPYRVDDRCMYRWVRPTEIQVFTGKAGDVLFIDSSHCFHYGSREAHVPRYQMMYAFTPAYRADFTEHYHRIQAWPEHPRDSNLRKMLLHRWK